MNAQFETIRDALDAGYSYPNRQHDKDTSGHNSFGYSFTDGNRETVTVWFSKEKNKIGQYGNAFMAMYPPEVK